MPSKMATCCREKAVLVAVYVEKPQRKKSLSNKRNGHHHHHHRVHHHHHYHLHQTKGSSNRRADLLNYSHRLRESAKSGASTPNHHHLKPAPPVSTTKQLSPAQPMAQIIRSPSKTKHKKAPMCMNCMIPNLFKSLAVFQVKKKWKKEKKISGESASTKAKAIMKSFKGSKKKGPGFFSKVLAIIQKYR